jgi:hypothetical protein
VVAEFVAAVQDPARHVGMLAEPAAHGHDREVRAAGLRFFEEGLGQLRVAVAVEGEGDLGPAARGVVDLGGGR